MPWGKVWGISFQLIYNQHHLKNYILLLITLTTLLSCNNNREKRKNQINRIVFATGGCYGKCPVQAIDIDSSLGFKYHGEAFTENKGFFIGSVTAGFWDTLNIKFEQIHYESLDTLYDHSVDDLSTEILIYYKDKVKHIHGQSESLPANLKTVYEWLMTSINTFKFQSSKDSLEFPTNAKRLMPPPIRKNEN
jgi:hypothetical protein